MLAKKGVKLSGHRAIMAIIKEYKLLDELNVFDPKLRSQLSKEHMAKALRAITVIKQKRCGRIKTRTVADGRPHRAYTLKENSSSPTVSRESLFLSLVIDTIESRKEVTADIARAYLKADMTSCLMHFYSLN